MRAMTFAAALVLAGGCGRSSEPPGAAAGQGSAASDVRPADDAELWGDAGDARCVRVPGFAATLPVAEASGAVWLELDGVPGMVVVGDSGTGGEYNIVDAGDGRLRETGWLPLGDGASDDLEGLAVRGDRLVALTSAGWVRTWKRAGKGWALVDGPYPIAAVDTTLPPFPARGGVGAPPTESLCCAAEGVNCGKNYEGLCLVRGEVAAGECVGFAAAKNDGRLYCLREGADGRLVGDATRSIAVTGPEVLTGCDFAPDEDTLWAGTNALGLARIYQVNGWRDPATATSEEIAPVGEGFPEAIAIGPGRTVYRLSDTGGAPSGQYKYRCR